MLVDPFNRAITYLRISVTDRCDLRCSYCMPKGFKGFSEPKHWLTFAEITQVVRVFASLGVQHFRLTGGEPLLRKNLADLVANLSAINGVNDLSLTTNGTRLTKLAQPLKHAGLTRFNVSLDSLQRECVQEITGLDSLGKVLDGLMQVKALGFTKTKINMVPLSGVNQDEISQMVRFCIENGFILRLIEVMPLGVTGQKLAFMNLQHDLTELVEKFNLIESNQVLGAGPARYWRSQDGEFSLGLITPMSQHFCTTCNRVRMTVDGTLYMCLGQDSSLALRPVLRAGCSDEELAQYIKRAIALKPEKHDFNSQPKKIIRVMSMTGG